MKKETLLSVEGLTFGYETAPRPLFENISFSLGSGWCGIVGANGSGKTTLARLLAGQFEPDAGMLCVPRPVVHAEQVPDSAPDDLPDILAASDAATLKLINDLGLGHDWPYRWETLSGGEKKRAQIAAALYASPAVLILDEPTNHIDAEAADILVAGLSAYPGIGLVVSHDRNLLDRLTVRTILLEQGRFMLLPGGVSAALDERERRLAAGSAEAAVLAGDIRRLERSRRGKLHAAGNSAARLSKRGLDRGDHDGRERIDRARLASKDKTDARAATRISARIERLQDRLAGIDRQETRKEGVTARSEVLERPAWLRLDAFELALGDGRTLRVPALTLPRDGRVLLTGKNGSGKTTLTRHLAGLLAADDAAGRCRISVVPQEIPAETGAEILRTVTALSDEERGRVLSFVFRLGSEPLAAALSAAPSPGELRKLLLALAFTRPTGLLILDEPTNHMDPVSVRCLARTLSGYAGALFIVSHDAMAFAGIATAEWRIEEDAGVLALRCL